MMKKILIILFLCVFVSSVPVFSQEAKETETLSLNEFIELACARDKVFEEILIESLKLN